MYKIVFFLICCTTIMGVVVFAQSIWPQIIVPKFLSRRHILTYYALDEELHFQVSQVLHHFMFIGKYKECEDGTAVIKLLVPIWKERQFLTEINCLEHVEVI